MAGKNLANRRTFHYEKTLVGNAWICAIIVHSRGPCWMAMILTDRASRPRLCALIHDILMTVSVVLRKYCLKPCRSTTVLIIMASMLDLPGNSIKLQNYESSLSTRNMFTWLTWLTSSIWYFVDPLYTENPPELVFFFYSYGLEGIRLSISYRLWLHTLV